jgi:hypothetical protein
MLIAVILIVTLTNGEVRQQNYPTWSACSQVKNSIERNPNVANVECREIRR